MVFLLASRICERKVLLSALYRCGTLASAACAVTLMRAVTDYLATVTRRITSIVGPLAQPMSHPLCSSRRHTAAFVIVQSVPLSIWSDDVARCDP